MRQILELQSSHRGLNLRCPSAIGGKLSDIMHEISEGIVRAELHAKGKVHSIFESSRSRVARARRVPSLRLVSQAN